jgi:hypothetical protein
MGRRDLGPGKGGRNHPAKPRIRGPIDRRHAHLPTVPSNRRRPPQRSRAASRPLSAVLRPHPLELYSPKRRRRPGTRPGHPTTTSHCSFKIRPGANHVRVPNQRSTSVATITGQRARSTLPAYDTPGFPTSEPGSSDDLSRTAAEAAWHAVTCAGTRRVTGWPLSRRAASLSAFGPARMVR